MPINEAIANEQNTSAKSCHWYQEKINKHIDDKLKQQWQINNKIIARILARRGFVTNKQLANIFRPKLINMQNPNLLFGIDSGVKKITSSIINNEYIGIITDYDVDGACSASLLCAFLDHYNIRSIVKIPDRLKEGYGPNSRCLQELKDSNCDLIITLDCGSGCQKLLGDKTKVHCPVVIIDHHISNSSKSINIKAHINPNQQDDRSGLNNLCATGVVFMVLIALQKSLNDNRKNNLTLPKNNFNLKENLDLVALATVCDLVPLNDINRIFVTQGIKVLRQTKNHGLKALIRVSKIKNNIATRNLGFTLGPRLNAGSRMGSSDTAFKLLSATDSTTALQHSVTLNEFNDLRRTLVKTSIEKLEDSHKSIKQYAHKNAILCGSESWSMGIVGLLASSIVEKHHKPAFVMSFKNKDHNTAKGSARSIRGINLANLLKEAVATNAILSGGGHAMAAGFELSIDQIPIFADFLDNKMSVFQDSSYSKTRSKKFDEVLLFSDCNIDLLSQINKLSPFGMENDEPIFRINNTLLLSFDRLNINHIAIKIADTSNAISFLKGINFGEYNHALGNFLKNQIGQHIDIICRIQTGLRQNNKPDLYILDAYSSSTFT